MPDTTGWPTSITAWTASDDNVAAMTARIIGYRPTSITVHTRASGQALPGAQTVRIEPLNDPGRYVGEGASQSTQWIVVLGYKDHSSIADTDLVAGDRFTYGGVVYEVAAVRPALRGALEAYCYARR